MTALFVALGIMVLALLVLLLWFVPHLLQQQAQRVAGETSQLREMLLDLLTEQEAVTMRQTQLGATLSHLQDQLVLPFVLARGGAFTTVKPGGHFLTACEQAELFTGVKINHQRRADGVHEVRIG